jgi:uncharacterized damage-inducible protein DinB
MKPMTVDHAEFWLHDVLLGSLKNEHRTTKSVIEAIPAGKADYRPDPNAKSALELAWHIAVTEIRFLETVLNGAFDTALRPRPESFNTPADIAAYYAEGFEKNFAKLAQFHGDALVKMVDFRGLFQLPAVCFAQVGMTHSIHHRGQLSTYLRPMSGKVPAIYGESYDSAEARKAAKG